MKRSILKVSALAVTLTASLVILVACLTRADVEQLKADAAKSRQVIDIDQAKQQAALDAAKARGDIAAQAKADKALALDAKIRAALDKGEATFDAAIDSATGGITITSGVTAGAALLPPPWNLLVMLGLQVVPDLFAGIKAATAGRALASAIASSAPPPA